MVVAALFAVGDASAQDAPAPETPPQAAPQPAPDAQEPAPAPDEPPPADAPGGAPPAGDTLPSPEAEPEPSGNEPEIIEEQWDEEEVTTLPAPGEEKIEEVTVTARRREESVQTVPVSVTAFNAAQLERSEIRDLNDIEAMAPNVVIDWVAAGPGAAGVTIRGVGFRDVEKSFEPAVGILLDGIYIGTNTTALLNNFDLESIEVLRGPQGTLFGRNTTAGIINVRRTRPTGVLGGKASVTVGRWGRHDYKSLVNFPITDDLAGKLSFYSLNNRGLIKNITTGENAPDSHYYSGAVDLQYSPTDDSTYWLKYERVTERARTIPLPSASDETDAICNGFGAPGVFTTFPQGQCRYWNAPKDPNWDDTHRIVDLGKFEAESAFRDNSDLDLDAVTAEADWTLKKGRLVSLAGFRGHDEDVAQDFDGSSVSFYEVRRSQRFDQVSEELRLEISPVQEVNLVAGLYYFYGNYDLNGTVYGLFDQPALTGLTGLSTVPGNVRIQDTSQATHSGAGFASVDYEVLTGLRLSAGGRYTYEHKTFEHSFAFSHSEDVMIARAYAGANTEPRVKADKAWSQFTPRAGIDYSLPSAWMGGDTHSVMLYGTFAQGFKSGGFNGRADPASAATYDPELVNQWETGVKTSWAKRRLFFNVAAFYTDYQDKQEETLVANEMGGQQTLTTNAASATIKGLEFEVATTPIRGLNSIVGGLRLWGNLGLLDAKYNDFVTDLNGAGPGDAPILRNYKGLRLRDAAPYQFGVGASNPYELHEFGRLILYSQYRFRPRVLNAFTVTEVRDAMGTKIDEVPDDRGKMPAFGQLDASLSLEIDDLMAGQWRVTAFGRNLTNQTPKAAYLDIGNLFSFQAYQAPVQWGFELAATY
jgi:iron complex outermembrane receptor protein